MGTKEKKNSSLISSRSTRIAKGRYNQTHTNWANVAWMNYGCSEWPIDQDEWKMQERYFVAFLKHNKGMSQRKTGFRFCDLFTSVRKICISFLPLASVYEHLALHGILSLQNNRQSNTKYGNKMGHCERREDFKRLCKRHKHAAKVL